MTSLAPFDEHGKSVNLTMGGARPGGHPAGPPPKGQRTVYRPGRTFKNMTPEEVQRAAEKSTVTFTGDPNAPSSRWA